MDPSERPTVPDGPSNPDFSKVISAALRAVRQGRMPAELLIDLVLERTDEALQYFVREMSRADLDGQDEEVIARALQQSGTTHQLTESLFSLEKVAAGILARRLKKLDAGLDLRVAVYLKSADAQTTMRALELLEEMEVNRQLIPLLFSLLSAETPQVQSKAATLLQKLDTDLVYARRVLQHTDPRVRANALQAIADRSDSRSIELFKECVSDPDNRVRTLAAVGLARTKNPLGMKVLREMLLDSSSIERRSAAWGLGACGDAAARGLLDGASRSDPDARVRELAAAGLQRILSSEKRTPKP